MTSILLSDLPDLRLLLVKLIAETQANTCLSCPISCSTTPGVTRTSSAHVVRARRPHADDVRVTPGVVLHEIGQLRQVFAWVSAINLTSNNRRPGKSDKRKPSWTALHKDECLTCWRLFWTSGDI